MHRRHHPDRLGAECRDRLVHNPRDHRKTFPRRAERRCRHVAERNFSGACRVLQSIAAPRDAGGAGIDEKKPDPVMRPRRPRDARADDQPIRLRAGKDEGFVAGDAPGAGAFAGAGGDIGEIVTRLPLVMGEGHAQRAAGDRGDQLGALHRVCRVAQEPTGEHHGREIGFEHETAPERLHDDHGLDRAAAEPALGLGEGEAEKPHFGIPRPEIGRPALRGLQIFLPLLEIIMLGDEFLDAVLEQRLFLAKIEIHFSPQRPRIALAMMLRWISFEPP